MSVTAKALIQSKFAAASVTTEYTVPSSTRTIIDKFTVTNTDSGAQTVSIYLVPSGSTFQDSNLIVKDRSIAAGATTDLSELKNQILNAAGFIAIGASIGSKVVVRVSGREVT